jgi:hypothetical protein
MFHCGRDSLVESACFSYRDGRNSKHPLPVAKWRSSLLSASIASSTYRTEACLSITFRYSVRLSISLQPSGPGSASPSTRPQSLVGRTRKVKFRSDTVSSPWDHWAKCWHNVFETGPHGLLRGVCSVGVLHRSYMADPGDLTLNAAASRRQESLIVSWNSSSANLRQPE